MDVEQAIRGRRTHKRFGPEPVPRAVLEELRGDRANPPQFEAPGNIVFMPVDRMTGEAPTPSSQSVVDEAFISGTQPIRR